MLGLSRIFGGSGERWTGSQALRQLYFASNLYNGRMLLGTPNTLPRLIAWPVPVVLLIVLVSSSVIFRMLVRRWTRHRHWLELSRWADDNRMQLFDARHAAVPAPLANCTRPAATASIAITSQSLVIAQLHTEKQQRTDSSQFVQWHVMVRSTETHWPPTGLRPRANASSVLDLFPLSSFPSMAPPERFVIFGTDSAAARRIAKSSLLALLPPDIGLLLNGSALVIDFSARPFDAIELSRLCALTEQLLAHLPAPP
jgi:hypothetical protein